MVDYPIHRGDPTTLFPLGLVFDFQKWGFAYFQVNGPRAKKVLLIFIARFRIGPGEPIV